MRFVKDTNCIENTQTCKSSNVCIERATENILPLHPATLVTISMIMIKIPGKMECKGGFSPDRILDMLAKVLQKKPVNALMG